MSRGSLAATPVAVSIPPAGAGARRKTASSAVATAAASTAAALLGLRSELLLELAARARTLRMRATRLARSSSLWRRTAARCRLRSQAARAPVLVPNDLVQRRSRVKRVAASSAQRPFSGVSTPIRRTRPRRSTWTVSPPMTSVNGHSRRRMSRGAGAAGKNAGEHRSAHREPSSCRDLPHPRASMAPVSMAPVSRAGKCGGADVERALNRSPRLPPAGSGTPGPPTSVQQTLRWLEAMTTCERTFNPSKGAIA